MEFQTFIQTRLIMSFPAFLCEFIYTQVSIYLLLIQNIKGFIYVLDRIKKPLALIDNPFNKIMFLNILVTQLYEWINRKALF